MFFSYGFSSKCDIIGTVSQSESVGERSQSVNAILLSRSLRSLILVTCDGLEANHAFHMGLTTTLNSEVHARLKVRGTRE